MSNVLNPGNDNTIVVTGEGDKICNISAENLPIGTSGSFKVCVKPDIIQPSYINSLPQVAKIRDDFTPVDGKPRNGMPLENASNIYVDANYDNLANVSNVYVHNGCGQPRRVEYKNSIDLNDDIAEIPQAKYGQKGSYLLKAIVPYSTIKKNLNVKNSLIPTISNDYSYLKRTSLFHILVERTTQLATGQDYIATGEIKHHIPYYTTIEDIESSLADVLKTSRFCERIVCNCQTNNCHHINEEVIKVFNKQITFKIDPRFDNKSLGLNSEITIHCDIAFVKYDDFDLNGKSCITIKKIHQSFCTNNLNNKYVVSVNGPQNVATKNYRFKPLNTHGLIPHQGTGRMSLDDLVLNDFIDESNGMQINLYACGPAIIGPNAILMQKDVMVFQHNLSSEKLYSLESFPDFVISPKQNVLFTDKPYYNKMGAFYSVYLYKNAKQLTVKLGVELLGHNANGSIISQKAVDQTRYYNYVIKKNHRLVFWEMDHVAQEQILMSFNSLHLSKHCNSSNIVLLASNAEKYDIVLTKQLSTSVSCFAVTLRSNKNIFFDVTKNPLSGDDYFVDTTSFKFDMNSLRNVVKFNLINALPFDVTLNGDKTLFEDLNPYVGTYGVLANNTDVCKSYHMAICLRQAFSPNLWDMQLLSFADEVDEMDLDSFDLQMLA